MTNLEQANDYIERLNRRIASMYRSMENQLKITDHLRQEIERLNKLLKEKE